MKDNFMIIFIYFIILYMLNLDDFNKYMDMYIKEMCKNTCLTSFDTEKCQVILVF